MAQSYKQTALNSRAHIPQHIEQAMNQHMQQSMPAHLRKYVGADSHTYVPQHVQQQIAQHMQKSMPTHLKQYAGAYMQQRVIEPNAAKLHRPVSARTPPPNHPQMPDKLRLGHSMPYGEQHTVGWASPPADQNQPNQAVTPEAPDQAPPPDNPYHFIMNPEQQPRRPLMPSSLPIKIGLVAGGLLILLIIFNVVRGLLSGSSPLPSFVAVAQDQQAIIHLVSSAKEQPSLSTTNKNFAVTAELSLTSSKSALIDYLGKNGQKVDIKQLNLKVDSQLDQRLQTAAAATTYNQTFKEIMQAEMTEYMSDLQGTYQKTTGKNGRALLSKQYDEAQLLLNQLGASPAATEP